MLPNKFVMDLDRDKAKKKMINGGLKNTEFFNDHLQYFFAKISGIGPWVSRIN